MTRNTKGGKAHRKSKSDGSIFRRELWVKEEGQEYAIVTKVLGHGHVECTCYDNVVRLGHIRGKIRRRVFICLGDIVLCGLRDYQDGKVDILHKYNPEEVRNLQNSGELPEKLDQIGDTTTGEFNKMSLFQEEQPEQQDEEEMIDFSSI